MDLFSVQRGTIDAEGVLLKHLWRKRSEILDGRIVDEDQIAGRARRKGRSDRSEYLDLEEDHSQSGGNEREIGHDFVNSHQLFTPQNVEQAFQHLSSKGKTMSMILILATFQHKKLSKNSHKFVDDVRISEFPLKIQA